MTNVSEEVERSFYGSMLVKVGSVTFPQLILSQSLFKEVQKAVLKPLVWRKVPLILARLRPP